MQDNTSSKRPRFTWKKEMHKQSSEVSRDPEGKEHSALADRLLLQWSAGLISAVQVQIFAHAALLDGANHSELTKLAAAGNFGEAPGNCGRDLTRMFLAESKLPQATMIPTVAVDPKTGALDDIFIATFLPHLMFYQLQFYENFNSLFGVEGLQSFWQGIIASGDPRLARYGFERASSNWMSEFIPCFIHGDGAAYQTRDSLMAFVWGSLLSLLASVDMSFLLTGFPKSCTVKDGHNHSTWHPIWVWIVWSFGCAFKGKHPHRDPFGKPFPKGSLMEKCAGQPLNSKGFKLCIWVLEGDHDYFSNMLDLPHWSTDKCCWTCNTQTKCPLLSWKHLKHAPDGWQEYTVAQAVAIQPKHPFFTLQGVTQLTVGHDGLHVLFCKGVLSYLMGGCLHTMLWPTRGRQIVSPQKRLDIIFNRAQELYKELKSPTRLTNLKIEMFSNADKPWNEVPFLKIKGAECKHFLPVLARISREISTGSEHDIHRTQALQLINEFCELLDRKGMFLTATESAQAIQFIEDFFEQILWLHSWAQTEERLAYHYTIKFHMLHHLALACRYLNPRFYWCFKAEDNVGKLAIMSHSVSMGVKSTNLSIKLCDKYRDFLHFRFTRGDHDA